VYKILGDWDKIWYVYTLNYCLSNKNLTCTLELPIWEHGVVPQQHITHHHQSPYQNCGIGKGELPPICRRKKKKNKHTHTHTMHSSLVRVQNLFGFFTTVAFVVGLLVAVSSMFLQKEMGDVKVNVRNVQV